MDSLLLPPPWSLQGRGYLMLYWFSKAWLKAHPELLPMQLTKHAVGGLGAVMLVDYQSGDAKPYHELLIMPGRFAFEGCKRHCISDILVSTKQSVASGQANWAIPKRLAQFNWQRQGRTEQITVAENQQLLATFQLHHYPVPLPMHTKLLPMPLAQPNGNELLLTDYVGHGRAYPAKLVQFSSNHPRLAPLSQLQPLISFYVDPFALTFPVAVKRALTTAVAPLY